MLALSTSLDFNGLLLGEFDDHFWLNLKIDSEVQVV